MSELLHNLEPIEKFSERRDLSINIISKHYDKILNEIYHTTIDEEVNILERMGRDDLNKKGFELFHLIFTYLHELEFIEIIEAKATKILIIKVLNNGRAEELERFMDIPVSNVYEYVTDYIYGGLESLNKENNIEEEFEIPTNL